MAVTNTQYTAPASSPLEPNESGASRKHSCTRDWRPSGRPAMTCKAWCCSAACRQLCLLLALVHGRSLEYSRQYNIAPQQNANADSMQVKQAWQTRANTLHAQAWARQVQVPGMRARRARAGRDMACASKEQPRTYKGLCRRRLCRLRLCCKLCLWMHNAQSKARAGG